MAPMTMPEFRQRQADLRRLADLLPPRTHLRRRLERELRGLVASELRREVARAPTPAPDYPEDEDHPLLWFQK